MRRWLKATVLSIGILLLFGCGASKEDEKKAAEKQKSANIAKARGDFRNLPELVDYPDQWKEKFPNAADGGSVCAAWFDWRAVEEFRQRLVSGTGLTPADAGFDAAFQELQYTRLVGFARSFMGGKKGDLNCSPSTSPIEIAEQALDAIDESRFVIGAVYFPILREDVRKAFVRELKPLVDQAIAYMKVHGLASNEVVTRPAYMARRHKVTARELGISRLQFTAFMSIY